MMPGGLDGIYKLHTCENSRPAFLRKNSLPGGASAVAYGTDCRYMAMPPHSALCTQKTERSSSLALLSTIFRSAEDRLLWYFEKHKDWDISNGTAPQPVRLLFPLPAQGSLVHLAACMHHDCCA